MRGLIRAALLGAAVIAPLPVPIHAQQAPVQASLGWFNGEWEGDIDFIGRPAKGKLVVRPGLVGSATVLTFTADVAPLGDRPAFRFEGQGTYRIKPDGSVVGLWADSYGNFHELKGRTKPGELRVTWGDALSEVGHSSYVLATDGVLTVTDSAFVNGTVQIFGKAAYRKKS
ncbi:hypothetical protein [Novosphingobium sp. B 225]|uniref:hypothetical protein n=1 Tax=Novosphingobium sp. B 225 TaxID=1961849 RepID=UPI000B4B509F|nr:hypothetical protein [Novosphingobium sp. B 225]